ncbi:hypothetical protein RJ640_000131 [Escallonia rubra]|uniref:Rho-GAP domain-containing protein n=1 Tax=Escallonia rubra TaxID=112253 RepID=A0AA88RIG3_9ASTE|nr:hypothetical protein RJ640_000131 [Escallonia rubra]
MFFRGYLEIIIVCHEAELSYVLILASFLIAFIRVIPIQITEEESFELVKQLRPTGAALLTTDAALLNWAIDLMADVVEQEDSNKMNARNIAMIFAPN